MFFPNTHQGLARSQQLLWKLHWVVLGLLLHLSFVGCHKLRLPAIDPNGHCLFLPLPNTTQLTVPHLHSTATQQGFLPVPAYQSPSTPPPCLDGSCEPGGVCNLFHRKHECLKKIHDHFRSAGKAGELQLTPLRVVAPVGGEVVLLAGICGDDGYLVKREPIEWMLAPDSVGQIIEVDDDSPGKLSSLFHPFRPKVEKLDVDFAKGRTSSSTQVINRGTADCNDDIHLRDGETWVSVSSPTAGVSRLTALAPESKIWDQRRQTAVIYWLDAQWEFPQPQVVKADQRIILRTKVTKAEALVPATGWLVQYTIVDPTIATFAGPPDAQRLDQRTIRSVVNADGIALAELAAVPGALGTTPVLIDVISPAQPSDNLPELPVGRGQTFATFSAAGLQLQVFGPGLTSRGEQISYTATLANPGDLNAENSRLILNLPQGLRFLSSSLQPSSQTDIGAVWDQGVLPANRQLDVTVYAEAVLPGTFEVIFQGEAAGVNPVRQTIRTEVTEPMVDVRFAPAGGISQAETGETVLYEIDVTNTGRQSLANLKLMVKADPALAEVNSGSNEVEQVISLLQPGESRRLGIPFRIQQEGQHKATLRVISGNTQILQRETSILGLPPRPKRADIGVEIQFPLENVQQRSVRVGDINTVLITLRNSGQQTLTNLEVLISADENVLEFTQVDINNRATTAGGGGRVSWTPGDLLPGDRGDRIRELRLNVRAKSPTPSTNINVIARAAQGVQASASAQVEVRSNAGSATPPASPSVNPPSGSSPAFPAPSTDNAPSLPAPSLPAPTLPAPLNGSGSQGNSSAPSNPAPSTRPSGRLAIEINDFNDPEVVGKQIRYGLTIANQSDRINNRVQVELRIPPGCEMVAVSSQGSDVRVNYRADGLALLPEIQTLRIGEKLQYIIVLRSRIPQQMQVEASVRSDLFPNPETAFQVTTIVPAS